MAMSFNGRGVAGIVRPWRFGAMTATLVALVSSTIVVLDPGQPAAAAAPSSYVALGDSYSAGEGLGGIGTGGYLDGTDVKSGPRRNQCHRSKIAYSQLISIVLPTVSDRSFWACSGALAADMSKPAPQSGNQEQYHQPAQTAQVGAATRWISISAGGNDAGFGDIGLACAQVVVSHGNT